MADSIRKYKSAVSTLCSKIEPDRLKRYLLVKQNDEFNYKLIKYIWWKNFHIEVKHAQLEKNHSSVKSNYDTYTEQSCWIQTTEFKDNGKLRNKLDTLSEKIAAQPKKKHIHKSLKILNVYGMLCCKYQHLLDDDQQNSAINFIKQNLKVILNQGKLKKTKIIDQEADKLIGENKKILEKIAKIEEKNKNYQSKSDLWIREIIFEEVKQHINKIHEVEQVPKNTCKIQQIQQEVNEVKDEVLKCIDKVITRGQPLKVLLEKTEDLKERGEELFVNTKRIRHKTANNNIFYYALTVVATIVVTALICYCMYTTFSKPNQSLDNVALMQNMGKLINPIT